MIDPMEEPTPPAAGPARPTLGYLAGYPQALLTQVHQLIDQGLLAETLARRYPESHAVRTDRALYAYVTELKSRHLRKSEPLSLVAFDNRLELVQRALGTHRAVSRVQGSRLKAKREIRIAGVFRDAPAAFLRMIVVHELAHLKEPEHDKAFYALCRHMEPDYPQLEFDTRLWLTARDLAPTA